MFWEWLADKWCACLNWGKSSTNANFSIKTASVSSKPIHGTTKGVSVVAMVIFIVIGVLLFWPAEDPMLSEEYLALSNRHEGMSSKYNELLETHRDRMSDYRIESEKLKEEKAQLLVDSKKRFDSLAINPRNDAQSCTVCHINNNKNKEETGQGVEDPQEGLWQRARSLFKDALLDLWSRFCWFVAICMAIGMVICTWFLSMVTTTKKHVVGSGDNNCPEALPFLENDRGDQFSDIGGSPVKCPKCPKEKAILHLIDPITAVETCKTNVVPVPGQVEVSENNRPGSWSACVFNESDF